MKTKKHQEKKYLLVGDVAGVKSTVAWAARSGRDAAEKITESFLPNHP